MPRANETLTGVIMLKLPGANDVPVDVNAVLALAENLLPAIYVTDTDPMQRARTVVLEACKELTAASLAKMIEERISEVYRSHEIISEPRDEVQDAHLDMWDESLGFLLEKDMKELIGLIGAETFERLAAADSVRYHEVGRISEVAAELAKALAPFYVSPPAKDVGKFLSKIGIVDKDLKRLAKLAEITPVPPEPQPEPEPAPEPVPAPVVTEGSVVPPTKQEIADAFVKWIEAVSPDFNTAAENLEVSAGTLRNYAARKTQAKINSSQAAVIVKDCEESIDMLQQAMAVFKRIPPPNGN